MSYFINLSVFRHNRNFRNLYIGQVVSLVGTMITSVALPYQMYHETHSTLMVGLLSFVQLLPLLLTALIGGALADRHHRKTLLLLTETLLTIGCLLLTWNAFLKESHLWVIFLVATFMSAVNGLHRPALDSITQQIVAKKDYSQVGALLSFKFSICMIAAPAIAGWIIARFGLTITFLVDFATFLVSLLTILRVKDIPKPCTKQDEGTFVALKQGFRYAISRKELLGSYLVDFVAMIFGMPMALFPAIAHAHGGVKTLGLLYSAPAVGALVISFLSGWVAKINRHGFAIAISAMLWGVAIVGFGLAQTVNVWVALFFLALAGAFDALSGIFRTTLWNETIPSELRGRLAGIEMISYLSGPKLGDTEAGIVAAAFGITFSVVSGGMLCVISVAICCALLPNFWRYHSKDSADLSIEASYENPLLSSEGNELST